MKKNIYLIILSFFLFIGKTHAQQMLPTEKQVNTFIHSRTYFVFDNNIFGMYNNAIEEAAKKHWKITDFDFINKDEFKKKIKIPTASMVVQTESHFEGQEELGVFSSLSLILGKPGGNINTVPDIITVPLAYSDVDDEDYYYKLGLALVFMQNHVQWLKNNPHIEDKVLLNHYKNSRKSTKTKTLWLLKNEMADDVNTPEKIKQYYDGDIKFVSKEQIKEAVDIKNPDVLVLHIVAPTRNIKGSVVTKMILSTADAGIYYFDYHRIKGKKKPNKFLKSDFQELNKL